MNTTACSAGVLAILTLELSRAVAGQAPPARGIAGFPVVVENCGVSTSYVEPPKRAVAMNQAATEIMLALGLQDRMAGTAYLDDAILPAFAAAYGKIPVLAAKYPSREVLLSARPDFVYAAYTSAFDREAAGPRDSLVKVGARSYISPSGCAERSRLEPLPLAAVYGEIRDIGRMFGVSPRAEQLIAGYEAEIRSTQATIGAVSKPLRVFWYDSGDPPSAGACCGVPNEIIRLVGAENVFSGTPGSWTTVSWEEVVARNPDAIVLVDASWSSAADKRRLLTASPAYASMSAVRAQRFVTIGFSSTTPGIRNVSAVRALAAALYPGKFR